MIEKDWIYFQTWIASPRIRPSADDGPFSPPTISTALFCARSSSSISLPNFKLEVKTLSVGKRRPLESHDNQEPPMAIWIQPQKSKFPMSYLSQFFLGSIKHRSGSRVGDSGSFLKIQFLNTVFVWIEIRGFLKFIWIVISDGSRSFLSSGWDSGSKSPEVGVGCFHVETLPTHKSSR